MLNQDVQSNSKSIHKEAQTVTLFLHLPVRIAKQLLDRVDTGAVASPSMALLNALYVGEFVGRGPQPEAEIRACLSTIQQRASVSVRLNALLSQLNKSTQSSKKKDEQS